MSALAAPFLMRRGSMSYVRVRVPKDLVELVGCSEVRRSLGPLRFHEARLLAARTGSKLKEAFEMMRNANDLTKQEVLNLIRDCFAGLSENYGQAYQLQSTEIDFELAEQQAMADEHMSALVPQVEIRSFDPQTLLRAKRLVADRGVDLTGVHDARLMEIIEGVVRAMIEADRQFSFRLTDRLTPYVPEDPLFLGDARNCKQGIGLTVDELIEEYCKAKRFEWTAKTMKTHRPKLKLLSDFLGGDTRAESVTRDDMRPYPEALARLKKNYHLGVAKSLQSSQTNVESARIQASTATTILARATAMFRWAHAQGFISSNPAVNLTITAPKKKKGHRSRRPFTEAELRTLFSAPLFTGCESRYRRFVPGSKIIKDEYFFIPAILFYTGARLGEIVQLHFTDCVIDGPTPYLSINENSDAKHGEEGYKSVKSDAGVRLIPIHPDLMALGFGDFVKWQRKGAKAKDRVFYRIKFGEDGQPSTVFSKWFGRFMDKIGLTDPALVAHSFRHTAEDYFRENLVPKYIIDQLIGHQDQSSAGAYGAGIGIEAAYEIVANLKLPVRLTELIPNG